MGGQALQIAKTRRYEKDEYFALVPEVVERLKSYFADVHVVQAYANKPSFGDMDILVKAENVDFKVSEMIQNEFAPQEIARNSHVYSFDFKELQIDVILVKPKFWETSKVYYSFNDLGNLMGRVANRIGLKYGHFGLGFKHTHNGRSYGDIVISQDLPKVFAFLGFSWEKYQEGFNELEDVFEYVIDSELFTPQLFAYENLDHQNRTRNAKRKTYQAFLDYLVEHKDTIDVDSSYVRYHKGTNMTEREWETLAEVDAFFGTNVVEQIQAWNRKLEKRDAASKKFNGKVIMEKYGFEGKELGDKIATFKKRFPNEEIFYDFVSNTSLDEIFRRFENANKIIKPGVKRITLGNDSESRELF